MADQKKKIDWFYVRLLLTVIWTLGLGFLSVGSYTYQRPDSAKEFHGKRVMISLETYSDVLEGLETRVAERIDGDNKLKVCIVVAELGLSKRILELTNTLFDKVIFGFTPYTENLVDILEVFDGTNRRAIIKIPLYSEQSENGPLVLSRDLKGYYYAVEKYLDYIDGVYTDYNESTLGDESVMDLLFQRLKMSGLFFLYNGQGVASREVISRLSERYNVKLLIPDMIILESLGQDEAEQMLKKFTQKVHSGNTKLLLSIEASIINLKVLKKWLKENERRVEVISIDALLS